MADLHSIQTDTQAETPAREIANQRPQDTEEQMRAKMIEQQRRMRCVGCGEGEEIF